MKARSNRILILSGVALVIVTTGSAFALYPRASESHPVASSVDSASSERAEMAESANPPLNESEPTSVAFTPVAPKITAEFRDEADFIRNRWADGPNLAEHYLQFSLKCPSSHDCRKLIIANMKTGELIDTGMGYDAMPHVFAYSKRSDDTLRISWENIPAGNCARAVYRWNGEQLAAVSDIEEFDYTDAGCDRALETDPPYDFD